MSEFKREHRYWVFKRKYLKELKDSTLKMFHEDYRYGPVKECVVVESDWPEYESVWRLIQDRVEGKRNQIADLEQQLEAANARVEALEFALTPSVETKAAYWGERTNNWTLIKGVMADIKALAAARSE